MTEKCFSLFSSFVSNETHHTISIDLIYHEWQYYTEGRHHLLLSYHGTHSDYQHTLLRVEKILPTLDYSNNPFSLIIWDDDHYYELLKLFFSPKYLIPSRYVELPNNFLENIAPLIYSSSTRPIHRQSQCINLCQTHAQLIPNLNVIHRPPPLQLSCFSLNSHDTLTVEFKVKSGLLSISPFLPLNHIKRYHTKFEFMQYVKLTNKKSSPISSFHLSRYNPNDLCSQDYRRIRFALSTLQENPQNNFIISLNGQRVYGFNDVDGDQLDCALELFFHELSKDSHYSKAFLKTNLDHIIATLLTTESALVELQILQATDLLDSEGMAEVYHHLLNLISANESIEISDLHYLEKSALEMVSHSSGCLPVDICRYIANHRREMNTLLLSSPPENFAQIYLDNLNYFANDVQEVQYSSHVLVRLYLLCLRIGSNSSDASESNTFVRSLSLDECILLLKLWLLSLAAADASAILTLGGISLFEGSTQSSHPQEGKYSGIFCSKDAIEKSDLSSHFSLPYHLLLIDIGPKPVDKILEKIRTNESLNGEAENGLKIFQQRRES